MGWGGEVPRVRHVLTVGEREDHLAVVVQDTLSKGEGRVREGHARGEGGALEAEGDLARTGRAHVDGETREWES